MDVAAYAKAFLAAYKPYKRYWNYEDGCVLKGCMDLYRATGDEGYRKFVMSYLDARVTRDGGIIDYDQRQFNIDSINSGKALFFALEETGDERYRKAIDFLMQRLRAHPRCRCGSFWHKEIYPHQVWLDGLYMAQPFYMAHEMKLNKMEKVGDVVAQFKNARKYLFNEEKGLYYHGYDEMKIQPWANRKTGTSSNFWLRSNGWYLMALVDCIEACDEQLYEHYRALVDLFRECVRGILQYQNTDSGLFYQVIDHAKKPGNYTETSGSAMVAYALLKGVRLGVLREERYLPIGRKVFEGLVKEKLFADEDGKVRLHDICKVAGLGPGDERDGSVAYYLSEPRVSDDSKGVGPFLMAWSEYLQTR